MSESWESRQEDTESSMDILLLWLSLPVVKRRDLGEYNTYNGSVSQHEALRWSHLTWPKESRNYCRPKDYSKSGGMKNKNNLTGMGPDNPREDNKRARAGEDVERARSEMMATAGYEGGGRGHSKEHMGLLEAGKGKGVGSPCTLSVEYSSANHLASAHWSHFTFPLHNT